MSAVLEQFQKNFPSLLGFVHFLKKLDNGRDGKARAIEIFEFLYSLPMEQLEESITKQKKRDTFLQKKIEAVNDQLIVLNELDQQLTAAIRKIEASIAKSQEKAKEGQHFIRAPVINDDFGKLFEVRGVPAESPLDFDGLDIGALGDDVTSMDDALLPTSLLD
jgi:hypothetical protein